MNAHKINPLELSYQLTKDQLRKWYLIPEMTPQDYYEWQDKREALQKAFPKTDSYLMQCHNMPKPYETSLHMYDEVLDTCGIESIRHLGEYVMDYCNTGESYHNTVCYDIQQKQFLICSQADFLESLEAGNQDEYDNQWENWGVDEFEKGLSFLVSELTETEQVWFSDLSIDDLKALYESKLSSYFEATNTELILYIDQAIEDTTVEDLQDLFADRYRDSLEGLYNQSLITGKPDMFDEVLRPFWDSRIDIDFAAVEKALDLD